MISLEQIAIDPSKGEISGTFVKYSCLTIHEAFEYVRNLKYGRNADKSRLLTVFDEQKGTCSTKHALLKLLLDEQEVPGFNLVLGVFMMGPKYSSGLAEVLGKYGLESIPEAHNYLKFKGEIIDCTRPDSKGEDFERQLIYEEYIEPYAITDYKVNRHREILNQWLNSMGEKVPYSLEELWSIREQCIFKL